MTDIAHLTVVKHQYIQALKGLPVTCECGRSLPLYRVFRCYHCGKFICPKCAPGHFGPRPKETIGSN